MGHPRGKGNQPPQLVGKGFQKGKDPKRIGNGRKPIPPEVRRARELTAKEFQDAVSKIISMCRRDLEALVTSKESNVLDQLVATIWLKGIQDSSKQELNFFLERFLGKVAENHNFQGNFHTGIVEFLERMNTKGSPNGKKESKEEIEDEDFEDI